jgi:hypothetical protein
LHKGKPMDLWGWLREGGGWMVVATFTGPDGLGRANRAAGALSRRTPGVGICVTEGRRGEHQVNMKVCEGMEARQWWAYCVGFVVGMASVEEEGLRLATTAEPVLAPEID